MTPQHGAGILPDDAMGDLILWSGAAGDLDAWSTNAAPGSLGRLTAERGSNGHALRFDFTLAGHGAWALARRNASLILPDRYVVTVLARGNLGANELQVKLVSASGASVWWWRRRDVVLSPTTERLVFRQVSLALAWGPSETDGPRELGAVELAVASDRDGSGTIWIEDVRVEPRERASGPPRPRAVRTSSHVAGHEPSRVLDDDPSTTWVPGADDVRPWLELDLGRVHEWGGLLVDFPDPEDASASRLSVSDTGIDWAPLTIEPVGTGARRWLKTGEVESRFVRIDLGDGRRGGIARVGVVPIEIAVAPARWAAARAQTAPRGRFPRHLLGEQGYWAIVGGDGDARKGLLGEDGALEVDAEAFTVEPFLSVDGQVITWADVEQSCSLADASLPIPSVEWTTSHGLRLRVTAFASGEPGRSALIARYEVEDPVGGARDVRLMLAIRPFQVTPSWQSVNLTGGVSPISRITHDHGRARVNGVRDVIAVTRPDAFGAACSDDASRLLEENAPAAECTDDPLGFAEAVFVYDLRCAPHGREDVVIAVPLFEATPSPPAALDRAAASTWGAQRLADATARWRARLGALPVMLPASAAPFESSLRASLAWILVNREGARIQPGPRCYRRSWIRDGALTGMALVEMGFAEEARAFLRWYAPHQLENGRVPCAVDGRGIDPVAEHDSHGQLVWAVVELFRLTGDETFLRELWPRVLRAVDAIVALRAERTDESFRNRCCFGLLPESISHEGYAASPVHAYWDDFFAVRALADAADAAALLSETEAAARIAALRDAMRRDLHASITCTIDRHHIDFLPGSVELGDFDPTSSAIAVDPCGESERLPRTELTRTFERYWEEFEARRRGTRIADAYTPYEIRNATALLRLGWKERAFALLDWMIADQRPTAWRQWPEVTHRDRRAPRFLGDLPHGWVASSYVRSVRRLLAYERDDGALVLAAGIPRAWVRQAPGVAVHGLPTWFGPLHFTMYAEAADRIRLTFGDGLARPPGGLVVESPFSEPLREVVVDGRVRPAEDAERVHLRDVPAALVLRY